MSLACVRKSKLYTLRNRLLEIEPLIWIDKCKQNKSSNGRALLTPSRTQEHIIFFHRVTFLGDDNVHIAPL
jgi:hypothetical protein